MRNKTADKKFLTEYLKRIRTYSELKIFLHILDWYGYCLIGKRRHYEAFDFRYIMSWNAPKVRYLYNDEVSTGTSEIKNLYKVLEVN